MKFRNDADNPNGAEEEITTSKTPQLTTTTTTTTESLPSPPLLPTLPFDLVAEILCRLPVKLLLQLRCICKSWKSLISDPKFANKHLHLSKASQYLHHIIIITPTESSNILLWDSSIPSVFSALSTSTGVTQTQPDLPDILNNHYISDLRVCSCDGILCFTIKDRFPLLWNPSIRKFNTFPPLEYPGRGKRFHLPSTFSFGYEHSTHNYKIVAVSFFKNQYRDSVYTLGTDSWRRIQDFPYSHISDNPGVFVSGTVNWLAYDASSSSRNAIVSLDLENELYKNLLQPDTNKNHWTLGKLRDCLCIFTSSNTDMLVDVWIMKEYGNTKPWTKLYSVPYMGDRVFSPYYSKALYISEDGQVLMGFIELLKLKLFVYDSKNGTFNMPEFQNISGWLDPEVYVESFISPYS